MDQELSTRIEALRLKYATSGQELLDFLDGLIEADYITYWEYIRLDSLLSLQQPRTSHPDESIFIVYHQITELYFKLCLHELQPRVRNPTNKIELLTESISRCNRYFETLEQSFGVMVEGMERKQFLKFRMALIPASGFQSAQYRMIELAIARLNDLVHIDKRSDFADEQDISILLKEIYWKRGATLEDGGQKTLTLLQFENKYGNEFQLQATENKGSTISDQAKKLFNEGLLSDELRKSLRELDQHVNVLWPLQHYRSAVRYLTKQSADVRATGGTNWQKYLPPKFQKRIFFPFLWSEIEKDEWGKSFYDSYIK
ncbi:MAG: Tryptophan 2,3-dioxygenase [Owenweeksia sp. TMED14]|nr:MAG: Tryptophan 2,3-dioxygenase [Owenweeksia sp. TMED14]